MNNLGGD